MGQTMTTIALAVPASCSRLPFISLLPPPVSIIYFLETSLDTRPRHASDSTRNDRPMASVLPMKG